MITVNNFDDVDTNIFRPNMEIHQSIGSLRFIPHNPIDLRSYPSVNQFSDLHSTATTLPTPLDDKLEELIFRKESYLKKRNYLFDSLLYRFFNFGKDKINAIDNEIDKIEEEIYLLKRPEFQKEIVSAKDLIKKTNSDISKYKSEIDNIL